MVAGFGPFSHGMLFFQCLVDRGCSARVEEFEERTHGCLLASRVRAGTGMGASLAASRTPSDFTST